MIRCDGDDGDDRSGWRRWETTSYTAVMIMTTSFWAALGADQLFGEVGNDNLKGRG